MAQGEVSIGRVLARAARLVGAAPLAFLGTGLVLAGAPQVVGRSFAWLEALRPYAVAYPHVVPIAAAVALVVAWAALRYLAHGVLARAGVARLDGRPEPFGASVSGGLAALPALLGLALVSLLAEGVGAVLLLVPGIVLAVMWAVAEPALVIERHGVFAALGRSRDLTRGHRWRVFGLLLIVYGTYWVASFGLGVSRFPPGRSWAGTTALTVALTTAFVAIYAAIEAALYVELRDAREGPPADRLSRIFA